MAIVSALKRAFNGFLFAIRNLLRTALGLGRLEVANFRTRGVTGMDAETRARIERAAYELWLQQGQPEGRANDHWREAEAEIAARGMAQASTPAKMPTDVREALENAALARTFALERGQDVGEDVIRTLAETRLDQDNWTAAKETAFWQCYLKLNSKLNPITIDTVKAIRPEERKKTWLTSIFERLGLRVFRSQSPATIATRQYRVWGFVALLLVLFLQVYYAMGSALLTDFQAMAGRLTQEAHVLVERAKTSPQPPVVQEAQAAVPVSNAVTARTEPIPINLAIAAKMDTIESLNKLT